jgi:DNA-binding transcriptional LysR family regulator
MDFGQMETFVAIAEERSFRAAARRLHISQPAVSKQIKLLEESVKSLLFERGSRPLALTQSGKALLARANQLLLLRDEAVHEVRQTDAGLAGTLTIGFTSQCAFQVLPSLLRKIRLRLPKTECLLLERSARSQLDDLAKHRIDLALIQAKPRLTGVTSKLMHQEGLALALAIHHPLARKEIVSLADFAGDTLFLPEQEGLEGVREAILDAFAKYGVTPSKVQVVERVQTAIALTAAGLGVALVPESTQSMRMNDVIYKALRKPHALTGTYACWISRDKSPLLEVVRMMLTEKIDRLS